MKNRKHGIILHPTFWVLNPILAKILAGLKISYYTIELNLMSEIFLSNVHANLHTHAHLRVKIHASFWISIKSFSSQSNSFDLSRV
jgi:hypothetical protein